ncbi:Predicted arabinose efflux permease, MFS family [Cryptosporangium aurantiacum]|uniref:Predicted arabinose efflux permease, MFS family n=2 Tax=Cryptosporangium aurantiacum TaxID=134849 RepID=A0A1M7RIT3_9ACTN|nr:Predicted arabinose efflux permease, MFS family [Cryptosporangium aurantiacum]
MFAGTRALRAPAFRVLFAAQVVSFVGTWSQNLATSLLVLHLTGSAAALGLVTAIQFAPTLLLSPLTGRVLDRVDVRRLLITTASASATTALVLAALAAAGRAPLWAIGIAVGLFGVAQAFDRPGIYTLIPRVVDVEDRPSAISLITMSGAAARLAGPALAGVLYATVGAAACFAVNGASYVVVVAALVIVPRLRGARTAPPAPRAKAEPADGGLGLGYAWRHRDLRAALLANVAIGCLTFNFGVMLAAMVTFTYRAGSSTVGLAYSTDAIGAVLGGLIAVGAAVTRRRLAAACAALGLTIGAAGLAPNLVLFLAVLPVMGVAITLYQSTVTALVQQASDPGMLGRMMSLLTLGWFGTTPVGALVIGWVADAYSARAAMVVAGGTCLVCAFALLTPGCRRGAVGMTPKREGEVT